MLCVDFFFLNVDNKKNTSEAFKINTCSGVREMKTRQEKNPKS